MSYPEHKKLEKVQEESQAIGAFLDWLMNERKPHVELAAYGKDEFHDDRLYPLMPSSYGLIEGLLAEFYGVNLKKVYAEKEQMYASLVDANNERKVAEHAVS